ncbi:hypothetical protein D3C71_877750 [compost metagenome]
MTNIAITGGRVPPDIQYYLDGALECFDIPPDVYLWGRYFCPNITELLDSFDHEMDLQDQNHSNRLTNYGARLERLYLDWQDTADHNAVVLCLAYGVHYSGNATQIVREICGSLVEDERGVLNGIEYYRNNIRHNNKGVVYYDGLKMFERKRHFLESRYRIRAQWETLVDRPDISKFQLIWPELPNMDFAYEEITGRSKRKPPEKSKKKALKRSAALLDSITGENTVQLFLSGEEVSVTGRKYRFSLTKQKYGSISGSHGSAETRVYDLETNEFVCGLFVYTKNVTVFDHLASIVLHCKSGLEELIIEEANITARGNLDLLPDSKRKQLEERNRPPAVELALAAIDSVEESDANRIQRSIYGVHWREVLSRRDRVHRENEIAVEKLVKRVTKKYPYLFENKRYTMPRIGNLFHGPENLI